MSDEIKAATPAVDSGSNATTTDPRLDSLTDVIGEITNKVNNLTDVTNRVVNNMAAKVEEPEGESIDYADDPEAYFDRKLAVEREKLKKEIKQETKKNKTFRFIRKKCGMSFLNLKILNLSCLKQLVQNTMLYMTRIHLTLNIMLLSELL